MDHLAGSTWLGCAATPERRLDVRRQSDGRILLLVSARDRAGQLYEVPHTRITLARSDLGDLIGLLIDARKSMPG